MSCGMINVVRDADGAYYCSSCLKQMPADWLENCRRSMTAKQFEELNYRLAHSAPAEPRIEVREWREQ